MKYTKQYFIHLLALQVQKTKTYKHTQVRTYKNIKNTAKKSEIFTIKFHIHATKHTH